MKDKKRHVPLRTCVICGNKASKSEFWRIVVTPAGVVDVDSTGKTPGRGAYVCGDGNCVSTKGLKRKRLEYALRTSINDQDWEQLEKSLSATRPPD